jgi:multidrug efflux pump subunit AcrA (membrane-fusion protein)
MKNSRSFLISFIIILGIVLMAVYGSKRVIASEGHSHDDAREGQERDEHGHLHGEEGHEDEHAGEDEHEEEGIIKMPVESQELAGIQVMPIQSESLTQKILVNGRVAQDVETVKHVYPFTSGKITESFVVLGQIVQKGDRLCVISAQNSNESREVIAPVSGTIIAEFIKSGDSVDSASALYTIADMTRLSATFDVYEKDLANIKLGQKMSVYPTSYPDRAFPADIVFISPRVDESTYTTRIKSFVDNPGGLLKLGMSVHGEIEVVNEESYLTVPSDAVQNLQGESVVFVQVDEETFEKRTVDVKSKTSKETAVAGSLKKGDQIVVQGAFILKSMLLESEMEHAHDH